MHLKAIEPSNFNAIALYGWRKTIDNRGLEHLESWP